VNHTVECSEEETFGDGLQKKAEGQQYANFRDSQIFPTFASLPEDYSIDLTFYNTINGFIFIPRKHWCFLAEIVEVELFLRLRLTVRDKAGVMVPIAFYTEGRGSEFALSRLQPGHTIAILYAHQHDFLDLTTGIRQEECCEVKILPLALAELLKLNDRVRQYSTELEGKRTCHGCNKKSTSLQKCGKCLLFW